MLAGSYQITDVLMLALCIGPVAVYFLTLGLVNSHSRPWMISSRSDFVSLTTVLIPLLIWPLPILAQGRLWWLLALAFAVLLFAFLRMLPSRRDGFVIYNIAEQRCRRILEDSIRSLGWRGTWQASTWHADDGRLVVAVRGFLPLRNVSLHIESSVDAAQIDHLRAAMESRFQTVAQVPSAMGACLVMLGVGLMIIPMWMVSRHIDDLVDAMSHLFG